MVYLCEPLISQGKINEAVKLRRTIWQSSIDSVGEDHPATFEYMRDLALVLEERK